MAKAKLTLKQEADMLSAVNQIKELEAAGKQLKKQADELRSQVKAMMDKKHLEEMDVAILPCGIPQWSAAGSTAVHFRRPTRHSMTSTALHRKASGLPFREVRR